MNSKHVFFKNDKFYLIKKDKYESMERFNERGWFIACMHPKTSDEFNEAVRLSRVWSNMKFDKCVYSDELTIKLRSFSLQ